MRISDWSSDVCSSDLHRAQQRGRAFRLWRQAVMQAFRQQSGSDVGHLSPSPCWGEGWGEGLLPSIALLIIVATPSRFSITSALEIGRASCRERVCQYE